MWWDCIIPEPRFKTYPEVSALVNVVGLHHPWTSVQNVSGDFGPRESGRIVSSLDLGPKVIRRLSSSCCGLQVVNDDDDVLFERSEYDDDDVAVRKIRV